MRKKLKLNWFFRNFVPLLIQGAFLLAVVFLPRETYVYSNFLFYLGLFGYCILTVEFSPRKWLYSLKQLDTWKHVGLTAFALVVVVGITSIIENVIPEHWLGMIRLPTDSSLELCLFACSTIFLAPIAEELFYRKSFLIQNSKAFLVITSFVSCVLYALNHAIKPVGIFFVFWWAIPFVFSYVKTENIYVPMTAHFLLNLIVNGATVICILI